MDIRIYYEDTDCGGVVFMTQIIDFIMFICYNIVVVRLSDFNHLDENVDSKLIRTRNNTPQLVSSL